MKICHVLAPLLFSTILMLAAADPVPAQPAPEPDGPCSPYFLINSDAVEIDRLPLKSTAISAQLSGVIADVTVTQVYTNEGLRPIEAVYIFPAATRAAVHGVRMKVGNRTIVAKIEPRESARRIYEQARQTGQSAALLEQQRPNVFQMNVANILPGDVVTVELRYTELLIPADGIYEFVYPTVVGPRYIAGAGDGGSLGGNWAANPYLHPQEPSGSLFDITINLQAGVPIQDIACDSHRVSVNYSALQQAAVSLDASETYGANRDFILRYRLSGKRIETGLLLFEGETENFFLAMLQPPRQVALEHIPPREYVFIVDVSGSMNGFPLEISKELISDLIGGLRPSDLFNVLLFAGGSRLMAPQSVPATPDNVRRALDLIDHQRGGGGTELLSALRKALALPRAEGVARSVVIATDGYVTVETEAFDLIRRRLGEASMIPFGIGTSVNRHLIEGMARAGMGEAFVVTDPTRAKQAAAAFRKLIATPVLTRIRLDYGEFDVYDVEPAAVPDLLAERPVIVFGKYRGTPRGRIRVTGAIGGSFYKRTIDVSGVASSADNRALRYLWARHRIAMLSDYNRLKKNDARTREVTDLGLAYNLLTETTSFVAVDTRRRVENGEWVTVKQPLPLPQGVSEHAVSGISPGVAFMRKLQAPMQSSAPREVKEMAPDEEQVASPVDTRADNITARVALVVETVQALWLSQKTAHKFFEDNLDLISHCCTDTSTQLPPRFSLLFTIDITGRIVAVETVTPRNIKVLADCLYRALQGRQFPAPGSSQDHGVMVTFAVKG